MSVVVYFLRMCVFFFFKDFPIGLFVLYVNLMPHEVEVTRSNFLFPSLGANYFYMYIYIYTCAVSYTKVLTK